MPIVSITRLPPYAQHVPVFKLGRFHLLAPLRKGRSAKRAPSPVFAYSLDEAANLLANGYQLLMAEPGAWWGSFVEAKC